MKVIILQLLAVVIPVLAGVIVAEWAKFSAMVNSWPTPLPELVGVAFAFLASMLGQFLGLVLPPEMAGWTQNVIAMVLTAVAQLLIGVPPAMKAARLRMGLRH